MEKTLGQRIRELRGAADLSLRELADKLPISPAFLSDIELGRRHPSQKVLARMAEILRTSLEDLRAYDTRPAIDEVKRRAAFDPAFGFALRQLAGLPQEEIRKFLEQQARRKK